MKVETYTDRYFLDVVQLVQNFHVEAVSEYDDLLDQKVLMATIKAQDPNNIFLLIVDDSCQGILSGTRFKSMINDRLIFQEIMWYVNKPFRKYGISLLREAENMLKSSGISIMIMAVLENSKTEKLKSFYERIGYKPMEVHYMRTL